MISISGFFFTEKIKIIDFWNSDFWKLLRPPLIQFSKFNNFLWVCWFLAKNLSNFVPPVWKLHNPYCRTGDAHKIVHQLNYLGFLSCVSGARWGEFVRSLYFFCFANGLLQFSRFHYCMETRRISKQSNNYSNYSCLHPSKKWKQEFELLLLCLLVLTDT